jgi:FtsP/CotA-like multicopper oxidase with cupredoxin domain
MLAALAPALGAGAVARLGGVGLDAPPARAQEAHDHGRPAPADRHVHGDVPDHPGFRTGATVDHVANGFHPTALLRDFDHGRTRRLASGRVLREWELVAQDKEVEVAPGVKFPAWVYNDRVPGPTLRAREGERLRIRFANGSAHPHTIHFHGIHPAAMDGLPGVGPGVVQPGKAVTYEFEADPFGLHLYHCHVSPLAEHIARGMYGAFVIDPKQGRPDADELVMVMNGFDTNFDLSNEVYAVNTVGFAYMHEPVQVRRGELVRIYLVNVLEFDQINSLHVHANFFHYFPTGTSLEPTELTDTIMQCQGQRGILELRFPYEGKFMFHAHQSEFAQLGWMGLFEVG